MSKQRLLLATTGAILLVLSMTGLGCKGGDKEAKKKLAEPITLQWWRVTDRTDTFSDVVTAYQAAHPNTRVQVRLIRPEEFDQVALEALASGTGPDMVSLPNTNIRAWRDRLTPLPANLNLSFIEVTGFFKKEPTAVSRTVPSMTFRQFRDTFLDNVVDDAVIDGNIYAMPLALDTLVMYYNRDLLKAANLPTPPATWTEFKDAVQKITKLDAQGRHLRNGASLGTADNVPYAADILSMLMLQNGTRMTDAANTGITFGKPVEVDGVEYTPGVDAVRFYSDFANPTKETYTWSTDEPQAWEAFSSGKLAFTFGYWGDYQSLKQRAPQVSLGVATAPQIDGTNKPSYFSRYYLEAVSKQSKHPDEAWSFLQFAANPTQAATYLSKTKRLTAHRVLIKPQLDDLDLGVPAQQLLASRSWYRGLKPAVAENAFLTLIRQVNAGTEIEEALNFAARVVAQTMPVSSR